jgi:hypothetical protein
VTINPDLVIPEAFKRAKPEQPEVTRKITPEASRRETAAGGAALPRREPAAE